MNDYTVEICIDGEPMYLVDLKSTSAERAERRARFTIFAQKGTIELERITATVLEPA